MTREKRMEFINDVAEDLGITIKDAAYELVFNFYDAAGFRRDELEKELDAKSEDELIEMFCEI